MDAEAPGLGEVDEPLPVAPLEGEHRGRAGRRARGPRGRGGRGPPRGRRPRRSPAPTRRRRPSRPGGDRRAPGPGQRAQSRELRTKHDVRRSSNYAVRDREVGATAPRNRYFARPGGRAQTAGRARAPGAARCSARHAGDGPGAGYMGSAMASSPRRRGHDVRLWGTWLDDAMLEPVRAGRAAPAPGAARSRGSRSTARRASAEALAGAELVVHAVNSEGAVPVMTRAAPHLPDVPVLSVTKGLLESPRTGRRWTASTSWSPSTSGGRPLRARGGAREGDGDRARRAHVDALRGGAQATRERVRARRIDAAAALVRRRRRDDIAGAELCSALKNAYATGLGLWDGHVGAGGAQRARRVLHAGHRRDAGARRGGRRARRDGARRRRASAIST